MVASSVEQFCILLNTAADNGRFNQLILVGSKNDISWVQALLPGAMVKYVIAEIQYPLMPEWFRQPADVGRIIKVLENLF